MTRWSSHYADRINNVTYEDNFIIKYNYFLREIINTINDMKDKTSNKLTIVEDGCGIAGVLKSLLRFNNTTFPYNMLTNRIEYISRDVDEEQLHAAMSNLKESKRYVRLQVDMRDMLEPNDLHAGVRIGHGVLEHFEDNELHTILNLQAKESDAVVHYVPSDKYRTKSFGNERLLTPEKWQGIFAKHFTKVRVTTFNAGYDICIVARGRRHHD